MKPISMWFVLGMSLFLALGTEAKAQSASTVTPIPVDRAQANRIPFYFPPIFPPPPIDPAVSHRATEVVIPKSLALLKSDTPSLTAIGSQPEPAEIFNANAISQDPTARAIIWGSGDGDPTDHK